jgi:peptide methionine sulfoxide reductase MsrA
VSNDEERKIADKMIAALNNSGEYECKIITEICDAEVFYPLRSITGLLRQNTR